MAGTLWVAVLGVVLSCLSLGWQAANYVLTGGRVRVTLEVGAYGGIGLATGKVERARPEWFQRLASEGFTTPVAVVTVANVGRQPVTVTQWGLVTKKLTMSTPEPLTGPPVPHRLEVGEAVSWSIQMDRVGAVAEATSKVFANGHRVSVVGEVKLGDGRKKRSAQKIR